MKIELKQKTEQGKNMQELEWKTKSFQEPAFISSQSYLGRLYGRGFYLLLI